MPRDVHPDLMMLIDGNEVHSTHFPSWQAWCEHLYRLAVLYEKRVDQFREAWDKASIEAFDYLEAKERQPR